jgi:hypothetical protein
MSFNLRYGTRIVAKPGTAAAIFARGRVGVVRHVADEYCQWLVEWGTDPIYYGFNPDDVYEETDDDKTG